MKLYTSIGPNPRVVRMFAAEKGIPLVLEQIDIIAGDPRLTGYVAINPQGSTPALVLESGQVVTEILAICEYLEEISPTPPLIGTTAGQRAETRMWTRRVDLGFALPITLGFRATGGRPLFEPRMRVPPENAGPVLTGMAYDFLDFLESAAGARDHVAGDSFSLADILLFCFVDFAQATGQKPRDGRRWLSGWHDRIAARPSAAA